MGLKVRCWGHCAVVDFSMGWMTAVPTVVQMLVIVCDAAVMLIVAGVAVVVDLAIAEAVVVVVVAAYW